MVHQEGAAAAAGTGKEGERFQTRPRGLLGSEAAFLELGAAPPPRFTLRRPQPSARSPAAFTPHVLAGMLVASVYQEEDDWAGDELVGKTLSKQWALQTTK